MSEKHKLTQSEIDGVQYRRAKLWQIILYACNGLVGMSVYSLIGLASYSASIGYGISTIIVGYILTGTSGRWAGCPGWFRRRRRGRTTPTQSRRRSRGTA